jgi:hypothetical protein
MLPPSSRAELFGRASMEPGGNQRKLEEDGFADQEAEATSRGRLRKTDPVAGALGPGAPE